MSILFMSMKLMKPDSFERLLTKYPDLVTFSKLLGLENGIYKKI